MRFDTLQYKYIYFLFYVLDGEEEKFSFFFHTEKKRNKKQKLWVMISYSRIEGEHNFQCPYEQSTKTKREQ